MNANKREFLPVKKLRKSLIDYGEIAVRLDESGSAKDSSTELCVQLCVRSVWAWRGLIGNGAAGMVRVRPAAVRSPDWNSPTLLATAPSACFSWVAEQP